MKRTGFHSRSTNTLDSRLQLLDGVLGIGKDENLIGAAGVRLQEVSDLGDDGRRLPGASSCHGQHSVVVTNDRVLLAVCQRVSGETREQGLSSDQLVLHPPIVPAASPGLRINQGLPALASEIATRYRRQRRGRESAEERQGRESFSP